MNALQKLHAYTLACLLPAVLGFGVLVYTGHSVYFGLGVLITLTLHAAHFSAMSNAIAEL
jgi:hypothetical protein